MPFSLQLFGGVLLQKARHSPKKRARCQKGAGHYHETLRLVSQPLDKVEAGQYRKIFHKNSFPFLRPVDFIKPSRISKPVPTLERSENPGKPTAWESSPPFILPRGFVNLLFCG